MIGRRRKPFRGMDLQLLFPIAVVVVLWFVLRRLPRRTLSGAETEPRMWGKRQLAREESALSNKEDEMEIRLYEKSREVAARIDGKLALLQELVSRAESAAARLERALAAFEALNVPHDGDASRGSRSRPVDEAAAPAPSDETPAGPDFGDAPPDAVWEEARSLATYGFSPAEISQQLGIPEGLIRDRLAK
ncbi:MAG: hypothetical protein GYA33_00265 [Thermogutta sp.]|nr:hypothetical protein [Thermogutta sp.]